MANGGPIDTSHAVVVCDVCGRTLLRGERCEVFIGGGERRFVCELCTGRALNEGWVREGVNGDPALPARGGERGRSLLGRLRQRLDGIQARPEREPAAAASERGERGERGERLGSGTTRPGSAGSGAPSAPREPRRVHAVPADEQMQTARALELFNASEHPRTVAGIARSLGPPLVSVVPIPNGRGRVSVLVGWELCWYRYEVDLAAELDEVTVAEQGDELAELGEAAPQPNATADEHGALWLASARR